VPLDKFKANLKRIITHPHIVAHKPKIFLVTPPPLDEIRVTMLDKAIGHPAAARQTKISAKYSEAVRQVAAETPGVTLIDLYKAIYDRAVEMTPSYREKIKKGGAPPPLLGDPEGGVRGYLEQLLPDGLHLSPEAYRIFYELVRPHISADEKREDYVWPEWRDAPWLEEDKHLKGKSL
jgi:lysophospholipase L1-like esterase